MTAQPKVWVVKEQVRSGETGPRVMDYTPAMEFGELRFITEFDIPLHPKSTVALAWSDCIKEFLAEFNPAIDYLILTGHTLAIFLLGVITAQKGFAAPQILVWRREQGRYVVFSPNPVLQHFNR